MNRRDLLRNLGLAAAGAALGVAATKSGADEIVAPADDVLEDQSYDVDVFWPKGQLLEDAWRQAEEQFEREYLRKPIRGRDALYQWLTDTQDRRLWFYYRVSTPSLTIAHNIEP